MVKILFDHNSPPRLARALDEIISFDGHSAVALQDKFERTISDIDLYTALGKEENWIVITKDKSQTARRGKKAAEREAILRSGIPTFFMNPSLGKMQINRQAAVILWQFDNIIHVSKKEHKLWNLPVRDKGVKFTRR